MQLVRQAPLHEQGQARLSHDKAELSKHLRQYWQWIIRKVIIGLRQQAFKGVLGLMYRQNMLGRHCDLDAANSALLRQREYRTSALRL